MTQDTFGPQPPRRQRHYFTEKLTQGFVKAMSHALEAETLSRQQGLLQGLDPRIKLVGVLALILGCIATHSLAILGGLFVLATGLAAASRITPARLGKQVWLGVLLFTGVIALPSLVLVPGAPLLRLPLLPWAISAQGLRSAAFLVGRAETCATLSVLLILSTPWPHVLKAMRTLGVPVVLVAILGMTHRYLFILMQTANQMFEAQRSRIVAPMTGPQRRRMSAAAMGVLLSKAFQLSTDVHLAMVSRGFRGETLLLHDFRTRPRDWIALAGALALPLLILWGQA